jgi:hypothetical protein
MKRILIIILVALLLRLVNLSTIPPGMANDELNIAINAESILKTGSNVPGVVTGIIGKTAGDISFGIHSELSSYIIVPFIAVFGFSSVSVKIPFVLASIGIVLIGYLLAKRMFDRKIAVVSAALLAVNPWLIFFGRSAYESMLSSFFYLLSILLIIRLTGWKKIYSILPLIMGFLCYFSAKTLMIPVAIMASCASVILNKDRNFKPLLILNMLVIVFVAAYLFILPTTPAGTRINELKASDTSLEVNIKRTASLDSPLAILFENKVLEELKIRTAASLGELNLNYLFLNGQPETISSLSVPDHAFMYLIDLPLIILGLIFMAGKYKKQLIILLAFIGITLVPNFLNLQGTTYSIRTVILFPILAIISAVGFYSIRNSLLKNVILLLYIISILNFCYIYFFRLPIERSEAWFLSERVLSKYISSSITKTPDRKIVLVTSQRKLTFYKYLFYNGKYVDAKEIGLINGKIAVQDYKIGNFNITTQCPTITSVNQDIIIVNSSSGCPKIKDITIKSVNDAGDVFTISGDALCQGLPKNKYPLIKAVRLLDIEKLTTEDFCKTYVSDSR